ncbi:hypothetical protein FRC12_015453 [Ceratobasidium sp. 428]|nr:hypothetical protein FRC12_015453 [Ceratobasidium sp. 428]
MSAYFVKDLDTAASKETAWVSGGALYIFDRELSKTQKSDIVNSTLLAQLAADKNYDRITDTDNWYQSYVNTLGRIGWVASEFGFDPAPLGKPISAGQFVVDHLGNDIGSWRAKSVKAAVDAINKMPADEKALKVFSSNASSGPHANFQVGYCNTDDGNVVVDMGAFLYRIDQNVKNPLSSILKSKSATVSSATQKMSLNKYVYERVRDSVLQKLGEHAKNCVAEVPM